MGPFAYLRAPFTRVANIGALIIRMGFGGPLYYNHTREPSQNPIIIIKAPVLRASCTRVSIRGSVNRIPLKGGGGLKGGGVLF